MYDLADDRITEAKENLARRFVADIRAVSTDERYRSKERQVWECFEKGELSVSQESMLRELLDRCRQQVKDDEE